MLNRAPAFVLIGLLAVSSLGCIQHEGQLAIYLTGVTQFQQFGQTITGARQVNVEITSVAIREVESGQYITLAQGSQVYEILGLGGRTSLLALGDHLTEGTYSDIRLTFSNANSSVINDAGRASVLLVEPSTVNVPGLFSVVDSGHTEVSLEIDVASGLALRNNGNWVLRPVVRPQSSTF